MARKERPARADADDALTRSPRVNPLQPEDEFSAADKEQCREQTGHDEEPHPLWPGERRRTSGPLYDRLRDTTLRGRAGRHGPLGRHLETQPPAPRRHTVR